MSNTSYRCLSRLDLRRVLVLGLLSWLLPGATLSRGAPLHLYATDTLNDTVVRFDAAGGRTVLATGVFGTGLVFDASGNFYVSLQDTNAIRKFSPTGADLGNFATTGVSTPEDLAIDASGNLYVANLGNGTVGKFSPSGAPLGTFAYLDGAWDLAFDASGNLYVDSPKLNKIRKFSPTGQDLGNFATGLSFPLGMAFDASGDLYVSNMTLGTVRKFSPSGQDLGNFVTGLGHDGVSGPSPLAFDDSGNLYVGGSRYGFDIRKFSPLGADLGVFATNIAPTAFVIPVPEPATLSLVALGGLALIRRRGGTPYRIS